MPGLKTAFRAGALGLLAAGGGIFAVQADLLPSRAAPTAEQPALAVAMPQDAPAPGFATDALPAPRPMELALLPDLPQPPAEQPALALPAPAAPVAADRAMAPELAAPQLSPFGLACDLEVMAEAMPGAMIALDVSAPCLPGAQVTIGHSGLTLSAQTDIGGLLVMDIPAFENPAFVTVDLEDGTRDQVLVTLPDFTEFDRVGIMWEGPHELQIHALEFGAAYGEAGHIWNGNPGDPTRAVTGAGGFVTRLGSSEALRPMRAEIYTFPRDTLEEDGSVWISVEAPVTAQSCDQTTEAITLQTDLVGLVSILDLSFTQPGCDAIGEAVVLQNLFRDLRIAAN